jgi:glycosyltransferase involved in cell wall biosynthesis
VKIVLLGSVHPLDFDLSQEDYNRVNGLKFGRSVPVSDLAITLVQLGHDVTVIGIVMTAGAVVSMKTQNGVNLIYVLGRRQEKLKAITFYSVERKSILSQIASINPDIVNAHWTYEYALAAQDSGLPHIITVHDEPWEILKGFRNFYWFLRLLIALRVKSRSSENLVFVSEYIRTLWKKRMFVNFGEVIPNMCRLSIVKSNESARVNNVISVGNTNRHKNIRGLLVAWQMVVIANPNLRLHLVGPGLGAGDSMAKEFDSKFEYGQVTWHGTITRHELSDLYSRCKVIVHPSLHESFGLIYLEAFAGNLGIITLEKSGSATEVVGDAGLILKDDSPKSLSDAILNLTSNQTLLNQLTKNGRARLDLYSPNLVTRMYISLYERTVGTRK